MSVSSTNGHDVEHDALPTALLVSTEHGHVGHDAAAASSLPSYADVLTSTFALL